MKLPSLEEVLEEKEAREPPSLDEVQKERQTREYAREHFLTFVTETKVDYQAMAYHRYIAGRLQAWANYESPFMQIVLPPRRGKSELASRRLPAWNIGRLETSQILLAAHTQSLAKSFSSDVRRILQTRRYKTIFPGTRLPGSGVRSLGDEMRGKGEWETAGGLHRVRAAGRGTAIHGKGYNFVHVDDIFKGSADAHSQGAREKAVTWYHDDVMTRVEYPYAVLLVNTRWHRDDLAGHLQREEGTIEDGGKWEVIRFPERQDSTDRSYDPRDHGDMLWPQWFLAPWEYLPGTRPPNVDHIPHVDEPHQVTVDELVARALYRYENFKGDREAILQGRPVAPGGNIIKEDWIQRWERLPAGGGKWFIFCDPKGGSKDAASSRAVVQCWFRPHKEPANAYLVAQCKGLWDQPETLEVFRELAKTAPWHWAKAKYVEDKADGKSIVAALHAQITGMRELKLPGVGKEARYRAVSPYWKSGNVFIPPVELCVDPLTGENWNSDFIQEHKDAPSGTWDDQIDTSSMALMHFFILDESEERRGQETWGDWNLDEMKKQWGM